MRRAATLRLLRGAGCLRHSADRRGTAFRGYLLRRLVAAEFDTQWTLAGTLGCRLRHRRLFGVMHGASWLAGSVAGLVYGGLYAGAAGSATR